MQIRLLAFAIAALATLTACGGDTSTRTATPTKAAATATRSSDAATPTLLPAAPTPTSGPSTPAATATVSSAGESGIEGIVTIGPMCPVQRIDSPCPDRPYPADIVVLDSAGRRVASVSSGADGRFRLLLPPGSYTLSPQHKDTPPSAREQLVTVVAGRLTTIQIVYDSGIR